MSRWSTAPREAPPALPWPQRNPRRGPAPALLVSLLIHVLLLCLTFGGEGLGLPGLTLPWQARRAEVPDLRVVLLAPQPQPELPATLEAPPPPDTATPTALPNAATKVARAELAELADETPPSVPAATTVMAVEQPALTRWSVPPLPPASAPVIAAFGAASSPVGEVTRLRATSDTSLSREARSVELAQLDRAKRDAQEQAQQQAERLAATQAEAERQETARAEAARLEAVRLEAAKAQALRTEAARQETARAEAARTEAAKLEAERQEAQRLAAARQDAARAEAARQEADRQEAARRIAAQQESARREAAQAEAVRLEAARQEAARLEAARQEATRQAAARQDAARQEAARQEAGRQEAARAEAAKLAAAKAAAAAVEEQREARLRAIGQQLNEEAAKRDATRQAQTKELPSSWSSARRGRLFGRTDANAEMVIYAEAWARKVQMNQTFELVREVVKQPHSDPLVTVSIRADGTVESISFYRSSGVPAIDDAIRRVVESQANYPAFPPALAREYDVIEIRRTWHFDSAIRLY